jgi:outer membrane lipoprotein-sorting protein
MKRTIWLFCAAFSLSAAPANSLPDAFARMDAAAKTFRGMTANLQQTVYTALANDTSVSNGDIKLKRLKPGEVRMLVVFTQPDQKSAAFDGIQVKVYYPKTNVEQIYDVSTKKDMVEQVMMLGFGATSDEIKSAYDVTWVGGEPINGQPTSHLKLAPKSKEMQQRFRAVELWISDSLGVPLQQKFITSGSGDFNQFTYSDLKLASSLSDKDLQLKTAKGVQIKQVGK